VAEKNYLPTIYHTIIAFAMALGLTGFMFAIVSPDSARFSSPEYWHYKHHWSPGNDNNCTDNCNFIENGKKQIKNKN